MTKEFLDTEEKELKLVFKDLKQTTEMLYEFFSTNSEKYPQIKTEIVQLLEQMDKTKAAFYKSLQRKKSGL